MVHTLLYLMQVFAILAQVTLNVHVVDLLMSNLVTGDHQIILSKYMNVWNKVLASEDRSLIILQIVMYYVRLDMVVIYAKNVRDQVWLNMQELK